MPGPAKPVGLLRRFPFRLIGLLLLGYILYTLDLELVFDRFRHIGAQALGLAALAFVVLLFFRCWRWHALLGAINVPATPRQSILSCNASVWLGMATPGRVGEFRRAADLANRGALGLGQASALVLFDLALDLFVFMIFAIAGCLVLLSDAVAPRDWAIFSPLLLVGLFILGFAGRIISATLRYLPVVGKVPGIGSLMPRLAEGLGGGTAANVGCLTLGVSLAYVLMMMALTGAMVTNFGLLEAATIVGLAGVAGAIPITYFGLGTRDVVLIWYFAELGQSKETAVAVSFAFLLAQLIGIAVSLVASLILPRLLVDAGDEPSVE